MRGRSGEVMGAAWPGRGTGVWSQNKKDFWNIGGYKMSCY